MCMLLDDITINSTFLSSTFPSPEGKGLGMRFIGFDTGLK